MRFSSSIFVAAGTVLLIACSTAALSIGTPEEDIIRTGTTVQQLQARLGSPFKHEQLNPPVRAWELPKHLSRVNLLVEPTLVRLPDGKYEQKLPEKIAVTEQHYRFVGRLKRKHDVGESLSIGLMTLGLSEVFLAPAAVASKANEQMYVLSVWVSAEGEALAYRWTPVEKDAATP